LNWDTIQSEKMLLSVMGEEAKAMPAGGTRRGQ
jgi:hypothetical protein